MPSLPQVPHPPSVLDLLDGPPQEVAEALRTIGTPLTTDAVTTFVHVGPADQAAVQHFMAYFPGIPLMGHISDDIHAVSVELPYGSRVEYKLSTIAGHAHQVAVDPLNPRRATDPFGANSVAPAPGYVEPWWVRPDPGAADSGHVGRVRRGFVQASAFGHRRLIHWYRPHPSAESDGSLVIVHDGRDYVTHAGILPVLDNLIRVGAIAPSVVALIDPRERLFEYTDDPRHATFLDDVAETAARRFGIDPSPTNRIYLGSSMGAVAALAGAWRHGGVRGLALLSGSFVTALGGPQSRGDLFLPVIDFMARFAAAPGTPAGRIYAACGAYEGLAADNRTFMPVLADTGAAVRYEETQDGHHWHNWRDRLGAALTHLVPGPNPDRASSRRADASQTGIVPP